MGHFLIATASSTWKAPEQGGTLLWVGGKHEVGDCPQ